MKSSMITKIFGITLVVIALVVAILPQFTTCQYMGRAISLPDGKTVPMKCNWTAKGEIALSAPLLATGIMVAISRRKESRRNLSIMGMILGVFVMLLPASLIGVCAAPTMLCHTVMKPSLLVLGTLATLTSLATLAIRQIDTEKAYEHSLISHQEH